MTRISTAFLLIPVLVADCTSNPAPDSAGLDPSETHVIPVVVAAFYPVSGDSIDITRTGDWGRGLSYTRTKVDSVTRRIAWALEEGSRFHGYGHPDAPPSVRYEILDRIEFMEPLPTFDRGDGLVPMTDYAQIFNKLNGTHWVEDEGVKEFWIWGYHGGVLDLWESNMSGPYGDVSNSDRITTDLPVLDRTYTMYHYNYQRGAAEGVENHMHQYEALLNEADGRDEARPEDWPNLLFWGAFVGSDSTHKLSEPRRAGWAHYPPNAETDYEWANPQVVLSDMENWNPDAEMVQDSIGCDRWNCDHLGWFVYWMQNMPSTGYEGTYQGHPLRNWFHFLSDYDTARREDWKLWVDR